jgi:hypothetical protein
VETLTADTIQQVKALSLDPNGNSKAGWKHSNPVFLTTMTSGTKLVAKAELLEGRPDVHVEYSVRWGSKMMKRVTPGVHVHELLLAECDALKALGDSKFAQDQHGARSKAYLQDLLGAKASGGGPMFVWFKMDFVEQLTDLQSMADNGAGRLALETLRSDEALHSLGTIVAVDLFLDNRDRFRGDGTLGSAKNIFLQKLQPGQACNLVGLDFYNTKGEASNLLTDPPKPWVGLLLTGKGGSIDTFAHTAITSLNTFFVTAFQKTNTHYQADDLIPASGYRPFLAGVSAGATTLKAYLKTKTMKLPSGITNRMKLLGWKD